MTFGGRKHEAFAIVLLSMRSSTSAGLSVD